MIRSGRRHRWPCSADENCAPGPQPRCARWRVRFGKSTFAREHFRATEVISSDFCRGLVSDDENDQAATSDAFAVLHFIAGRRLAQPRFTVVDATNVQREARKPLVELAKAHDLFPVAIVLDPPESVCLERNSSRADRASGRTSSVGNARSFIAQSNT